MDEEGLGVETVMPVRSVPKIVVPLQKEVGNRSQTGFLKPKTEVGTPRSPD